MKPLSIWHNGIDPVRKKKDKVEQKRDTFEGSSVEWHAT